MLLSEVLRGINCKTAHIPDIDIENITAKTELINSKTLFILYRGVKCDINNYLDNVIKKNPALIISDRAINGILKIPTLLVDNARIAYSVAMYNFCKINAENLKLYAISGSNGKTTTATMLYTIFRKADIKCGFIGTGKILINDCIVTNEYYSMTTPDPELLYPIIKSMENAGCEKIVMEVSSHSLALFKVYPLSFECSVFTNLSPEHLDFHNTVEEYYAAKASLFKQSKTGIFNMDDYYSKRCFLESSGINKYSVGIENDADAMAKEINLRHLYGSDYIYREANILFKVNLNIGGQYNVSNSLLAVKCALLSGVSINIVKDALEEIKSIDGRLEKICDSPLVIIDYAHTDKALETVLKFIKKSKKIGQRLISVFGCGGERDKEKRPRMAKISEKYADFTYITSDNSRGESTKEILSEIEKGFTEKTKYSIIENRIDAINKAILSSTSDDIILIIGKGHERYNIDSSGYHAFDERKIIKKAIEKKNSNNENKNRNTVNTFFNK